MLLFRKVLEYSRLRSRLLIVPGLLALGFSIFYISNTLGVNQCMSCSPSDISKSITDVRSAIIQLILAFVGLGTVFFTWQTYIRTAREAADNYKLARESRTSENFIKAIEQLGNSSPAISAGGAFGLGRLLQNATPEGDYWPIMDVLTAFIRNAAAIHQTNEYTKVPEHVQAALNVLGRRNHRSPVPRENDSPLDMHKTNLREAWLAQGHFEWAYFRLCQMQNISFEGASVHNSNFTNANIDDSVLSGGDFSECDFRGASMKNVNAYGSNFERADLSGVDLSGADLRHAKFKDADIKEAFLDRVKVSRETFTQSQLRSARFFSTAE